MSDTETMVCMLDAIKTLSNAMDIQQNEIEKLGEMHANQHKVNTLLRERLILLEAKMEKLEAEWKR